MSFGLSFLDEVVAFVIQLAVKFSLNVRILRMLFWNFFSNIIVVDDFFTWNFWRIFTTYPSMGSEKF